MMRSDRDIAYEADGYWVLRTTKGFEVYKTGITHSVKVSTIGFQGQDGLDRAKAENSTKVSCLTPSITQSNRVCGMPKLSEAAIHKAVVAHWRVFGLPGTLVATIPNMGAMGQYGLTKGLPDLLVLAPGLPVGFIELKADKGRLSEAQLDFKMSCEGIRVPYALTFGRDEPIKILEKWQVVRGVQ